MGINLPVRQLVLYDLQEFAGSGVAPLRTNTVWQRVERAGRVLTMAERRSCLPF
jgi:helicase